MGQNEKYLMDYNHVKQQLVADQPYLLSVLPKLEEEVGDIPGILLFFILVKAVRNIDKVNWPKFVTVLENLLSSDSGEHRTLIINVNIIDPMVNMLYDGTLKPEQVVPFVGPYSKKHIRWVAEQNEEPIPGFENIHHESERTTT